MAGFLSIVQEGLLWPHVLWECVPAMATALGAGACEAVQEEAKQLHLKERIREWKDTKAQLTSLPALHGKVQAG